MSLEVLDEKGGKSYVKIVLPANSLEATLTRIEFYEAARGLLSDGTAN